FYTQGMAEETSGLSSGILSDASYLDQAGIVFSESERMLESAMDDLQVQGGLLFFYVSTSDLTSHMFWRVRDPGHPAPPPELPPGSDPIRDLYVRLDGMLGRVRERIGDDATLLVLSDHGFAPYRRSFDVNAWLASEGYLVLSPHAPAEGSAGAGDIDWEKTRAYGVGFNALYLNLREREGRGIVEEADAPELAGEIRGRLLALVDPATGRRVFRRVDLASEVYRGDRAHEAPDLVLGYERGYRTSAGSALLSVGKTILFDNAERWSGDHLMAAELVPGVLLSNRRLRAGGTPSLADLAPTVLAEFGLTGENLEGTDLLER
ncbi:MAG: alkaline phosphatase family protein, partial [Planctomycetes bacterium]|nr:alkaline phosphatase family protein [Planctomycetota bacterium]